MTSIGAIGLIARVLGGLIFIFFMIFIVGEGILGNPYDSLADMNNDGIMMIVLMVTAVIGLAIGFWHDAIGGIITTSCSLGWFVLELFGSSQIKSPDFQYWPFYLLVIAGVMYLISGFMRAAGAVKQPKTARQAI